MTLAEKRLALLDELTPIEDPHERFQYIIDRAKNTPPLDPQYKIPPLLIEGCTSSLWMYPSQNPATHTCQFRADADSLITKGIATLVCEYYSDATPVEILATSTDFLRDVGITQHLSPNRRNGLANLVSKIHAYATLCAHNPKETAKNLP
ncbi:MAG: SufE family protein [Puniceicoccales bacterium]|jgi:cysteine desulfuration protein SufE|nr:SufE family protein [Puniceicoccales bacterium]